MKRVNGKRITNAMKETAKENGISLELLRYRMKKNWDENRAVTEPPRKQTQRTKSDPDMLALAKENGISANNYKTRVRQLGWTELDAATKPLTTAEEKAALSSEARGGIPAHLVAEAKKNGIKYITLYRRLRVYEPAWDVRRAVTEPPLIENTPMANIFNNLADDLGIDWRSIRSTQTHAHMKYDPVMIAVAEANGISYNTLIYRLVTSKKKWTLLDAATIKPSYANGKEALV